MNTFQFGLHVIRVNIETDFVLSQVYRKMHKHLWTFRTSSQLTPWPLWRYDVNFHLLFAIFTSRFTGVYSYTRQQNTWRPINDVMWTHLPLCYSGSLTRCSRNVGSCELSTYTASSTGTPDRLDGQRKYVCSLTEKIFRREHACVI